MDAKIINPFVVAAFTFLEKDQNMKISKGKLSLVETPLVGNEVNTVIKLSGLVNGQVIYSMSLGTACKVASMMLFNMPVEELDELAQSAINEMGNIITGVAGTLLAKDGIFCNVTPPLLKMGEKIHTLFKDLPTIVIPIQFDFGEITMMVELKEAS